MKVGACRALSQLLPETKNEIIQPQMMGLFSSLSELLHQVLYNIHVFFTIYLLIVLYLVIMLICFQASDETLHMVLETLQAAIKAGKFKYCQAVNIHQNFLVFLGFFPCLSVFFSSFFFSCQQIFFGLMPSFLLITGRESSAFIEPIISPVILNVWALHISDPFISIDALEVLEVVVLKIFL